MIPSKEITDKSKTFTYEDLLWNAAKLTDEELIVLKKMWSQLGLRNSDSPLEKEK